jgi:hypothetical protein
MTGPATEPSPPMMTVATRRMESSGLNTCDGFTCVRNVMKRHPAKAPMPPAIVKARSFMRPGHTVDVAAMASLSRTAIIERPTPVRRSRATARAMASSTPKQSQ